MEISIEGKVIKEKENNRAGKRRRRRRRKRKRRKILLRVETRVLSYTPSDGSTKSKIT